MKITDKADFDCTSCVLGKQKLQEVENQMAMLLNLLNLYTRDGFRYGMTFIDDYSGAIFIYFLEQKSNAVCIT